jgi:uncharacterized paraquat-inducible protein A
VNLNRWPDSTRTNLPSRVWEDFEKKKTKQRNRSPYLVRCECNWYVGSRIVQVRGRCPNCGAKLYEREK